MEERIGWQRIAVRCPLPPAVLILIVMEERIGFIQLLSVRRMYIRLNPYCNGRKNRMYKLDVIPMTSSGLNPYCNGRKNRIGICETWCDKHQAIVLILIVMEERIG